MIRWRDKAVEQWGCAQTVVEATRNGMGRRCNGGTEYCCGMTRAHMRLPVTSTQDRGANS